ncbi:sensor domain-containing diguanylate cyclase [Spiribacter vilamensis]|nr:PAS domain S-box protein [Spiribacter vilamensis]
MSLNLRTKFFEIAIEQTDFPVCITTAVLDPPGPTTLHVNEAFIRLTGHPRGALIGATPRLHQGPATDRTELDRLREDLAAGEVFNGVVWNIRRDGTNYQVEWCVVPLRSGDGDIDHFASVQRDITHGSESRQMLMDETERMRALLQSAMLEDPEDEIEERGYNAEVSRDQAQAILKSSPVGVAFIDHRRRIQQVNPALERLLGYTASEMVGFDTSRFYADKAGFERVGAEVYPAMAAGEAYEIIVDLQRSDGTIITVSMKGQQVGSSTKEGNIWVLQDVTQQHARERSLRTYQAVFESSRDAVVFTAEDGCFTHVNPTAMALFEVPDRATFLREFNTPAGLSPVFQPDGRRSEDSASTLLREAFDKGEVLFEWQYQTRTGRTFPAEVLLSRVDLGDQSILEANIRDLTEKRAAMDALQRARDRAEAYFEAVPVLVMVIDMWGQITEINQAGCELLGLPREEIIGTGWFDRFVPSDEALRLRNTFQALRAGDTKLTEYIENRIVTASGLERIVAFRNVLLRDDAGEVLSILASGVDITQQRETEADLEHRATHDPLTGVFNRRRMSELIDAEIERVERYGQRTNDAFSAILFDVDHFKSVNDRYGHDVGDSVLKELVAVASQRLRDVDSLCRWGGEEFLVLLPATPQADAYGVAEALRCRVAETEFSGVGRITISLGVAAFDDRATRQQFLKRVDNRAYAAKHSGRNCVR